MSLPPPLAPGIPSGFAQTLARAADKCHLRIAVNVLQNLLSGLFQSDFMPHGYCIRWEPDILWLNVISDALITASYLCIPLLLVSIIRKRNDIPFRWMFLAFGMFILACGATHAMSIVTLWKPVYRLEALIKAVAAIASVSTAICLDRLIPDLLKLPSPKQLRQANEALSAEVAERKIVENALQISNRELEAFSYSVAHDLRAPLRGMSGFGQILFDDYRNKLDAGGVDCLEEIRRSAARMGTLIDALLSLSRLNRGELRCERVDLTALVRSVAADLAAAEPQRRVEVLVEDGLEANLDLPLARALMENLLGNAWKFTSRVSSPKIMVGADRKGECHPVYHVRDNGAGFDPAFADKLFAPFQRLHTQGEFTGTGIGLATAQRIVHRHAGRIWAEGRVGAGATFYFTFFDNGLEPGNKAIGESR
ncbi:MAG TPA: ATP-binding protein [Bryobacteraceae bacterium]|nr:ATP-binding protein [Bryobacteraceae bacterium]